MSWNRVAVVGAGTDQVRRAVRPELRADGGRRVRRRRRASVDKGFDRRAVDAASSWPPSAAPCGARRASAATPCRAPSGWPGIPCTRVENACPSGSDAFRIGAMVVASGVHDVVLVDRGGEDARQVQPRRACWPGPPSGHPLYNRGETAPVLFAPFATRHMYEFGTTPEMLASVAVKNHHNGCLDPYAHFQSEITVEQVLASPPVCSPLRLLDCCPQTDGAAAVHPDHGRAGRTSSPTSRCSWPASAWPPTTRTCTRSRPSWACRPPRWRPSAPTPWRASGPADIDMAEVHDCFTITEILDIEDLGLRRQGQGRRRRRSTGRPALDGRIPVNPSGGLLAKGHPIGATGVAQLTECWWQLRERGRRAPGRPSATAYALQHNVGGRGSGVSVVNILTTNQP